MKRFLLFFFLIFQFSSLFATHMMGGEITWVCQSNGAYVFYMKLYRDCNGNVGPTTATLSTDVPGFSSGIYLILVSQTDKSPVCNASGPAITCAGATGTTAGSVEEFIFKSHPIVLSGVPPANGWSFWWGLCCRNNAISNLNAPGGLSMTLRAKMYPYNGRNANPCFDNSPDFFEAPHTIVCAGYPYILNTNAVDNDFDSLDYNWDYPLDANTGTTTFNASQIPYSAPYVYDNPLPGTVTLDHQTGEINFGSNTTGTFVYVIKVSSYRCGQKIAEVFRDIQIVNTLCNEIQPGFPNHPPSMTPPFVDNITGLQTFYTDTVQVGDTVNFTINGRDLDASPTFVFQHLHMTASGVEFDTSFTNSQGACPYPPCATLSPSPIGYSPQINYATTFNWITSCAQLQQNNCAFVRSALFTFNFSFYDDFCPIPGMSSGLVKIVVIGDSVPSVIKSVSSDTLFSSFPNAICQWYRNDTLISGANLNFYVPIQPGNYQVEISHASGCSTLSEGIYLAAVNVASLNSVFSLDVNPNPFNHSVHVHAISNTTNPIKIILRDVVGKIISTWKYNSSGTSFDEEYNLSDLAAGIYFMQFKTGDTQKTFKLMKHN